MKSINLGSGKSAYQSNGKYYIKSGDTRKEISADQYQKLLSKGSESSNSSNSSEDWSGDDARSDLLDTMSYGFGGRPSHQNNKMRDEENEIFNKYGVRYEDDIYDMDDETAIKND